MPCKPPGRRAVGVLAHLGAQWLVWLSTLSSSGTRVPVWLRYLCSSRGWGLGGVGSLGSTAGVGEGTCFS
jgi:hypothetical protein